MIPILLWTASALAALDAGDDPPPRYLDEAAVIEGIEQGPSTLIPCFGVDSPPVVVPITLQIAREGTVRAVQFARTRDPQRDRCLENALSDLRFRPHDEPVDTWTTTLAWVDGALRSWPVVQRIRPPRGPVLVRVPPGLSARVAEALGVDPFPPHEAPTDPPPAGDPPSQDVH